MSDIRAVPIDDIQVSGENMRIDAPEVAELAESIKRVGLLQPILLNADLVLIFGHRRLAACRRAGVTLVPAVVRAFDDEDAQLEAMVAENVHRAALSPIEEALALKRFTDRGLTQIEIAKKVRKSDYWVSTRLGLLTLKPDTQDKIHCGEMTLTEGVAMVEENRRRGKHQGGPEARSPQVRWQIAAIDKLLRWIEGGNIPQHLPEVMKRLELLRRALSALASVSADGREIVVKKRKCRHDGCQAILSRFNRTDYCGPHERTHAKVG